MSEAARLNEILLENTRALRRALGLFDGAMAISPKEAWDEALVEVARLTDALAAAEAVVEQARAGVQGTRYLVPWDVGPLLRAVEQYDAALARPVPAPERPAPRDAARENGG